MSHPPLSEHLCIVINVTRTSKHNAVPANTPLLDKLGYSARSDRLPAPVLKQTELLIDLGSLFWAAARAAVVKTENKSKA